MFALATDNMIKSSSMCQAPSTRGGSKAKMKWFLLLEVIPGMSALEVLAEEASTDAPVLTFDETVSIALTNNRLVENETLDAQKYDFRVKTIRSRRLPDFQFPALGWRTAAGRLISHFRTARLGRIHRLARRRACGTSEDCGRSQRCVLRACGDPGGCGQHGKESEPSKRQGELRRSTKRRTRDCTPTVWRSMQG
jgi:hypothetical protein